MKKLLAAYSCFLFLRSFAQAPQTGIEEEQPSSGKKLLIKAIAVFVNSGSARKAPAKCIYIPPAECPIAW